MPVLTGSAGSHMRHSWYALVVRVVLAVEDRHRIYRESRGRDRQAEQAEQAELRADRPEGALAEYEPGLPQPGRAPGPDERVGRRVGRALVAPRGGEQGLAPKVGQAPNAALVVYGTNTPECVEASPPSSYANRQIEATG